MKNNFLRTRRLAPLFCLLFLLLVRVDFATDYFVDSQNGDDSFSGLSAATPWKTLERVSNAKELAPGDVVRFRAGQVWRGTLKPVSGEKDKPIVYTSYGEGKKPSIWRSTSLANESFWLKSGENLWATRPTTIRDVGEAPNFLGGAWGLHQESGAKVAQTTKKTENGGLVYAFDCQETGSASNHIQWCNGSFSVEKGRSYRLSFDARASEPVEFRVALMKNGAPWTGYGYVVAGNPKVSEETARISVVFQTTETADDARITFYLGGLPKGVKLEFSNFETKEVEIDALELAPDVGNIILNDGSGRKAAFKRWTLQDLKEQDDFCYERSEGRVWFYSKENPAKRYSLIEAALMKHVIDHSGVRDAVFDGLDVRYGSAHGFGGSNASRLVIRNCDISWIGGGDQYLEGGAGRRTRYGNGIEFWATASDCLVENCRLWEVYDAAITNQGAGVNQERNITYRDNLIWNCEYSFEYWNRGPESITDSILFEKNVCLDAGYGWGHVQRPDKNGRCLMFYSNSAQTTNFVVRDNIFANATESLVRSDIDWTPEPPKLDANVYSQEDETIPFVQWKGKRFSGEEFESFQKEANQEPNAKLEKIDVKALIPQDEE